MIIFLFVFRGVEGWGWELDGTTMNIDENGATSRKNYVINKNR